MCELHWSSLPEVEPGHCWVFEAHLQTAVALIQPGGNWGAALWVETVTPGGPKKKNQKGTPMAWTSVTSQHSVVYLVLLLFLTFCCLSLVRVSMLVGFFFLLCFFSRFFFLFSMSWILDILSMYFWIHCCFFTVHCLILLGSELNMVVLIRSTACLYFSINVPTSVFCRTDENITTVKATGEFSLSQSDLVLKPEPFRFIFVHLHS